MKTCKMSRFFVFLPLYRFLHDVICVIVKSPCLFAAGANFPYRECSSTIGVYGITLEDNIGFS